MTARLAGIMQNNDDHIISQGLKTMIYINSPLMAEALATGEALLHAKGSGICRFRVASDAKNLIHLIN
ncbi:unnamed protein product [Arabis nemorensis]|uniref:RNase H type-1 domain-containing protein n=1 Tax=Arabis nemorensis TaxID=586526 RepID=A0A565BHA5_9BRAS|nr:unnamed protein product [Arabis nemorensis]